MLLPPVCLLCGDSGYGPDICLGCRRDLPSNLHACVRCALPVVVGVAECPTCQALPPCWGGAFSAFRYEFPVDSMIRSLKFDGRLVFGRLLGQLLALELRRRLFARGAARPQLIVPVPLHPARLRERGFNQAAEIARYAGALLATEVREDLVARNKDTPPQVDLDAAARRRNLRNAFTVDPGLQHRHVAIVDDVLTTGATATALTETLVDAGAACVEVWTVARTLGRDPGSVRTPGRASFEYRLTNAGRVGPVVTCANPAGCDQAAAARPRRLFISNGPTKAVPSR